ncbi:MAG: M20/M25/M40 family metallo-hydrolase [Acidobacteriota bacterium]
MLRKLTIYLLAAFVVALIPGFSLGDSRTAARAAREYVRSSQHKIVRELVDLLSIPNVSFDLPNIQKNARHIVDLLRERGVHVRILEMDVSPLVYGELTVPGATRTLLFYAHYDGDPVEPSRWVGSKPFEPVLRDKALEEGGVLIPFPGLGTPYNEDWRIYARSASDDKSPIVALLAALDGLRSAQMRPTSNVKFLFEGEEEDGSPHLAEFLERHKDLFGSDAVIVADASIYPSGDPTFYFGARGIAKLEVTVYGPIRPLHSGHYGNWAPNPALELSKLLASMKDDTGRVTVEGFYDDVEPLSRQEREALRTVPDIEEKLRAQLGLSWTEGPGKRLPELINLPSLNIHGLESGWVGDQARTIIPSEASASIDLRLVKGIDPQGQIQRVIEHMRKQGFHVTDQQPGLQTRQSHAKIARVVAKRGYPAFRTPMDLPICRQLISAVERALGPTVKLPTMGGSVPLYLFSDGLDVPVIGLPTVNPDNNQHSPNENIRLGNFFRAVEIFAAVLAM